MLKKTLCSVVAVLALSLVLAGAALAKNINVVNGTSFALHGLALSPSESNNWGDDLLGDQILNPGEVLTISISGDANNWDMAAVDDEGTQIEFKNLDLRSVSKITLLSDGTANLE